MPSHETIRHIISYNLPHLHNTPIKKTTESIYSENRMIDKFQLRQECQQSKNKDVSSKYYFYRILPRNDLREYTGISIKKNNGKVTKYNAYSHAH